MTDRALILDGIFFAVPELTIVQGAYLRVEPAQICGLFGRNGSGKSTLLKIASGQLHADSGITIIDGERLHKRSLRRRFASIAYLPQDSMLPRDISVDAFLRSIPTGRLLLEDAIVGELRGRSVGELSGGERRYLEVAFVLSLGRKYVLLDEPFTGVEPSLIEQISGLISSAAGSGTGILLTDHYHHYVLPIAQQAYLMEQKQSYRLGERIEEELIRIGYIRERSASTE